MTTQEIIKMLRDIIAGHRTIDGIPTDELIIAADRLEELHNNLHEYYSVIKEREKAKRERDEARAEVSRMQDACVAELERMRKSLGARPEPSRLEIAAMIYAGSNMHPTIAIKEADALIAAAKEGK